jgi:uncharacterized protein involved in oxidation of intracellular sulfur
LRIGKVLAGREDRSLRYIKADSCWTAYQLFDDADAAAMANMLFVLNDAPYGTERSYNALRLAGSLAKTEGNEIRVFLLGDAAGCAKSGQRVPEGFYNLQLMLDRLARTGAKIGACGTCLDARGISDAELIEGARRSSLAELTTWTQWADKVLVF